MVDRHEMAVRVSMYLVINAVAISRDDTKFEPTLWRKRGFILRNYEL